MLRLFRFRHWFLVSVKLSSPSASFNAPSASSGCFGFYGDVGTEGAHRGVSRSISWFRHQFGFVSIDNKPKLQFGLALLLISMFATAPTSNIIPLARDAIGSGKRRR